MSPDPFWDWIRRRFASGPRPVNPIEAGLRRAQAQSNVPAMQRSQAQLDAQGTSLPATMLDIAANNAVDVVLPGDYSQFDQQALDRLRGPMTTTRANLLGLAGAGGAVAGNLGLNAAIPNVGVLEKGMTARQIGLQLLKGGAFEGATGGALAYGDLIGQGATTEEALRGALPQVGIQAGLGMAFRGLHGRPALREAGLDPTMTELGQGIQRGTAGVRDFLLEPLMGERIGNPLQPIHEYQMLQEQGRPIPERLRKLLDEQEARLDAEEAAPQRQERIAGAAVRTPEGEVFQGAAHFEAAEAAGRAPGSPEYDQLEHGFVTDRGRFVNRVEAQDIARVTSQTSRRDARGLDTAEFIPDRTPEEQAADPNPVMGEQSTRPSGDAPTWQEAQRDRWASTPIPPQQFHDHFFGEPDQLPKESFLGLNRRGAVGTFGTYGLTSRLPESIQKAKLEKAPAQTWVSKLRGAGNNASEFDWVVGEVLRRDPKRVWTRQQLLDLAQGKGINISERVLGASAPADRAALGVPTRVELSPEGYDVFNAEGHPFGTYSAASPEEALARARENGPTTSGWDDARRRGVVSEVGDPEFASYQVPGGSNYREVLVKLDNTPHLDYLDAKLKREGRLAPDEAAEYNRLTAEESMPRTSGEGFQSQHWDDPNVLLHLRMNDRIGPNGEKILFIEELQSDWMQKGRKEGFRPPESGPNERDAARERTARAWEAYDQQVQRLIESGEIRDASERHPTLDALADEAVTAGHANINTQLQPGTGGVPDAPGMFKETPGWTLLGLKRALDEAVAGGYDRMAWTTGAQQAERYNLAKKVRGIDVEGVAEAPGVHFVDIDPIGGPRISLEVENGVIREGEYSGKDLEDVVGKEVAEQILAVEPGQTHTLTGDDLRVGGQGMVGYYDQILPDALKAYGKKLGVRLDVEPMGMDEEWVIHDPMNQEADGPIEGGFKSEAEAQARLDEMRREVEGTDDEMWPAGYEVGVANEGGSTNQSIRIAPELREQIRGGQRLGRVGEAEIGGIPLLGGIVAGGAVGGYAGSQVGDTPEERLRNMGIGMGLGMTGGFGAAGRLAMMLNDIPVRPRGGQVRGLLDELGKIGVSHGTPHTFAPEPGHPMGRFRLDKIGTGEGAQAYGHGLYFAGDEAVAKHYRDTLRENSAWTIDGVRAHGVRTRNDATAINYAADALERFDGDKREAMAWLISNGTGAPIEREAAQILKRAKSVERSEGSLYHADIDAEPEHFLDWDKPLSEQSGYVRERLVSSGLIPDARSLDNLAGTDFKLKLHDGTIIEGAGEDPNWFLVTDRNGNRQRALHYADVRKLLGESSGEGFYRTLSERLGGYEQASTALREAGIPGNRYLDGGSRGAGQGSHNYVVFDDAKLAITGRNGSPLPDLGNERGAVGVDALAALRQRLEAQGVALDVAASKARPGVLTLSRIVVPKGQRGAGIGTKAMEELTALADRSGQRIELTPSDDFGATSVNRLKEFYKRFGFVENKGRNKDFTTRETMYRPPAEASGRVTDTPEFRNFFGQSKVVDAEGKPQVVYHGTQRPDRIGNRFRASRANSGPMQFFTDDPELASNYAKGKADTSLDVAGYNEWFTMKPKGARNPVPIDKGWWSLSPEERSRVAELAPRVTFDEDGNIVLGPEGHISGTGNYDWHLKEARGNHFAALVEEWLNSANLYNDEAQFSKVLELAGVEPGKVLFDDPHATYPGVYPVYLNIENPLDTSDIPEEVVDALRQMARRSRSRPAAGGVDLWDKRTRDIRMWVADLERDRANGTNSFVWTSIPDKVTDVLRRFGYDGIKDVGGKMGGKEHTVWVPFGEKQIKSATGNRGTFDPTSANITLGLGALAVGSQMMQDEDEPLPSRVQSLLRP